MDRAAFAENLREEIVASLREFREQHVGETPYGYALLGGHHGLRGEGSHPRGVSNLAALGQPR